jgi:hypothetical protein
MGSITFSRPGLEGKGVLMMAVLVLSSCAPARAPMLSPPQAATGPDYATVAAVRPIPGTAAGEIDPQADILTAMGLSPAATARGGAKTEIILRRDDGETLSVVEPKAADLVPGERVMVLPGDQPRLAPVPPAS